MGHRRILILMFALAGLASGCVYGRAWVIEANENGGVIGYRDQHAAGVANSKVKALIPCDEFHIVYDRPGDTLGNTGIASANDSARKTPVELWRELRYLCRDERAPSAVNPAGSRNAH